MIGNRRFSANYPLGSATNFTFSVANSSALVGVNCGKRTSIQLPDVISPKRIVFSGIEYRDPTLRFCGASMYGVAEDFHRIYRTLGIDRESYPEYKFSDGIVINPYKNIKLLLLPVELLHELPIARCWDDIDRVCRENEAIRAEINDLVGNTWAKMRSAEKKQYLRNWIFMNPERAGRIIDSYKASTVAQYDPLSDLDYLVGYLQNTFNANSDGDDDSFSAAMEIVDNYQEWVEYHRGAVVIQEANSRSKEKTVQRTIHAVALVFCKKFNWDISPETDSGRGPEDFKVSRGCDKTVVEVKLTSNPDCVHGLEVQIEEYAKAESTDKKIFILVNTGQNENRVDSVIKKHDEMTAAGLNPARVVIIDAQIKNAASTHR